MGLGDDLIGDVEELLARRTLRQRTLFRMSGDRSQCWRAEREIAAMYPGMQCLLLPSATIGLSLLLETLQIPAGREVLIAPFGWLSNWSCIRRASLVPRFMPLDHDLSLRPEAVAARLGPETGAVIVTHLMGRGQPFVAEIAELCGRHGVPLLEDIAQSLGTSVGGRRAGTFGAGAWCSLNHHKILSTGDGGFVLVRDEEDFARICALHDQGNVLRNGKRRPAATMRPGLSLRMTDLSAAVLRAQLARYHLIRARVLVRHAAIADACRRELGLHVIEARDGDVPFTVLFRRSPGARYPSLAESGAHNAANVPWLADVLEQAVRADPAVAGTIDTLSRTAAVGAGFLDKYYAIVAGLSLEDPLEEVHRLTISLRSLL